MGAGMYHFFKKEEIIVKVIASSMIKEMWIITNTPAIFEEKSAIVKITKLIGPSIAKTSDRSSSK